MEIKVTEKQMNQEKKIIRIINQNNFLYRKVADNAASYFESEDYEAAVEWIRLAATFAWNNHPGFFADGKIENLALEIGLKLNNIIGECIQLDLLKNSFKKSDRKRVLHIATSVHEFGGHTRLIKNWIESFVEFEHSLLLSEQSEYSIPDFLTNIIQLNGGIIYNLSHIDGLLEKACAVRKIVTNGFDYIFLHHHPNDVLPIIALATEDCPPVATVNHADHVFWLGSAVTDLVIDFNRTGNRLSQDRRYARQTTIVPFLLKLPQPNMSRAEAREKLGISEDEVVLITIGSQGKYQPTAKHNFFRTTKKILEQNQSAKLYLIGLNEIHATVKNSQMIFLGVLGDTTLYQIAADIYLDGFPLGGGLAAVESVLLNVCPVFAYGQLIDSTPRKLLEFENVIEPSDTEDEYINQVNELIQNFYLREKTLKKIKASILRLHSKDRLPEYAQETFGFLDKIKHQPHEILNSSLIINNADKSLAILQSLRGKSFPRALELIWMNRSLLRRSEFFELMLASFRCGDTKVTLKYLRAWIGTFIEK